MKKEWMKYYKYLEKLRQSGEVNMYGAVPYLQNKFGLSYSDAKVILLNWMEHYEEIIEAIKNKK